MLFTARTALIACLLCECAAQALAQTPRHPCLPCHPAEVQRFVNSPMGRSLSTEFPEPNGRFTHQPSGAAVTIYHDASGMHHKVEEHGLAADYRIVYSIGYGKVGRSYLIDLNGNLFQSPASFYSPKAEWSASPGYEAAHLLDFTRSINADCLSCHAGSIRKRTAAVALTPLSCDRCHGPVENHLKNPVPGSIVNPAKLPLRERDSVCEQCHLEGATTVLNPGKSWTDFRPGMTLESVETHYVFRTENGGLSSLAAVSHAEQLAVSACLRGSAGKLWCGTCHDPHGTPTDRQTQIKQVCAGCHPASQITAVHTAGQDDCVGCHMPRRAAADISHAAVTDHRILKRPDAAVRVSKRRILAVWQPPPSEIAERNLGLAWFHVARQNNSGPDFQRAYDILAKQSHPNDPEIQAALGYMLLGTGRAKASIPFFEAATRQQPDSSEYWLDLGVAQQAAGRTDDAIGDFSRSMELSRYNYRAYKALSDLYKSDNQPAQARQTLQRFLSLVPQSLTVRLLQ